MDHTILDSIRAELKNGTQLKGHPFRFFSLGTVGLDHKPKLRTVVLRNVSEDLQLEIYTDKRSEKVAQIGKNNSVCLLFYHPEKKMQLRIDGVAQITTDGKVTKEIWESMHPTAKKEYLTVNPPGTKKEASKKISYLSDGENFCLITITPLSIEYLKLQDPDHLRIRFSNENGLWKSDHLVP